MRVTRGWLVAAPALALAFSLMAVSAVGRVQTASSQMGPMQGEGLEGLSGDAFDRAWLQQMIMHHAMAVMMATPVTEGALHEELAGLARTMVADQTREIAVMRGWLKDWYGVDMPDPVAMMTAMRGGQMPAGMMPAHGRNGSHHGMMGGQQMPMHGMMGGMGMGMGMMGDVDTLSPPRLEVMFMVEMIPHHQDAVDMSRLAPDRAAHQELKELAAGIITGQSAEIDQMNAWLAAWYNL